MNYHDNNKYHQDAHTFYVYHRCLYRARHAFICLALSVRLLCRFSVCSTDTLSVLSNKLISSEVSAQSQIPQLAYWRQSVQNTGNGKLINPLPPLILPPSLHLSPFSICTFLTPTLFSVCVFWSECVWHTPHSDPIIAVSVSQTWACCYTQRQRSLPLSLKLWVLVCLPSAKASPAKSTVLHTSAFTLIWVSINLKGQILFKAQSEANELLSPFRIHLSVTLPPNSVRLHDTYVNLSSHPTLAYINIYNGLFQQVSVVITFQEQNWHPGSLYDIESLM